MIWSWDREKRIIEGMAGTLLSSSRAKAVRSEGRRPISVCVETPTPFVEGPGPGREWWEKALSEKSFSGPKRGEGQQHQGVGAKSRTTNLGPFGEVIRATGPMAKVNPFTFQTEFYDWETDKIYWKNRYYDSSPGRWLSRDPVNEPGFNLLANANSGKFQQNFDEEEAVDSGNFGDSDDGAILDTTTEQPSDLLYVFVQNNPVNLIDELGLTVYLQAHGVALGFNHSKVTMVVGCGSRWLGKPPFVNPMPNQPGYFYATIGAGPIHHMLVSGLNRSRDIQLQRNKFSTVIPDPAGMSDDDFIGKLIAANAAYPNDLPYALFPTKKGKRYNSNGYASGILLYVTGSMPPRPPHTPGFNKPVPASEF